MRTPLCALTAGLLASFAGAQTVNAVTVERNNDPWLVISTAVHAGTGNQYAYAPTQPTGFAPGTGGVAVGTRTVRWLPNMSNSRRENHKVIGFQLGIRPSAATGTANYPFTGYVPECSVHAPQQLAAGTGPTWAQGRQYSADLTAAALATMPQGTLPFNAFANFIVGRTMTSAVNVMQDEIVMSLKWDANGQSTPINDDNPMHCSFFASFDDGIHNVTTIQFASPTNQLTPYTENRFINYLTYSVEDQMVMHQQSDWGYRRNPALLPSVSGYSVATALSDVSTVAGQLGYDCDMGTLHPGDFGMPLVNFGPVFPAFIDLFGVRLEVNPADPNLTLLPSAGYLIVADAQGFANGPLLPIPALGPTGIGFTIGAEFVGIESDLSAIFGSSNAAWVTVNR